MEHSGDFSGPKRELDTKLVAEAGREMGFRVDPVLRGYVILSKGHLGLGWYVNMSAALLRLDRTVTNQKGLTKRILNAGGVPTIPGREVGTMEAVEDALREVSGPWVVKPVVGSGGQNVTVDLQTKDEVRAVARQLLAQGRRRILIEEMIFGIDLRITVLEGELLAATLRIPANVTGDGVATIKELVDAKNKKRGRSDYLRHQKLVLTEERVADLAERGHAPDSVPGKGERVYLHYVANISSGGDSYEVTHLLHPDLVELANSAAALFPSAGHAGIDVLAERLDAPLSRQRAVVCEVNLNNELALHAYPAFGEPTPVAAEIFTEHWKREASADMCPVADRGVLDKASGSTEQVLHLLEEARAYGAPEAAVDGSADSEQPGWRAETAKALQSELLYRAANRRLSGKGEMTGGIGPNSQTVQFVDAGREYCADYFGHNVTTAVVFRNPRALKALARLANIPVADHVMVKPSELKRAIAMVEQGGLWNVRYRTGWTSVEPQIGSIDELKHTWSELKTRLPVRLMPAPRVAECTMLTRGSQVLATQVSVPLSVVGDGKLTVSQLLEEEKSSRAGNPYLSLVSGKALAQLIEEFRVDSRVPAVGEVVVVGQSTRTDSGALTFNVENVPWTELADMSARLNGLVGGQGICEHTYSLNGVEGTQEWELANYLATPDLSRFAFPRYGPAVDTFDVVAKYFLAGPRRALGR